MDADVRAAIAASHLRDVPEGLLARLVDGAVVAAAPAGTATHREGDVTSHFELVVTGVVRVAVTAPDGRTMAIRYCRPGAILGALTLFLRGFTMPATTQAVVDTTLLGMDPAVVVDLVDHRPVADALLVELSERAHDFLREVPGNAFATVRQRVARHLLELAADRAPDLGPIDHRHAELVVHTTQEELAEAVGSVREVVVRILRELRDDGLVATGRGVIRLLDPAGMAAEEEWNLSS